MCIAPGSHRSAVCHAGHWCLPQCPICWLFCGEDSWEVLSTGEKIDLGEQGVNLVWLLKVAQAGCRAARDVIERLHLTANGREVDLRASMALQLEEGDFGSGWQKINFVFSEPRTTQVPAPWLGPGYTISQSHQTTIDYTLFTTEGSQAAECIKGRPANPIPFALGSWNSARRWIQECTTSHNGCPNTSLAASAVLPARLIDVGVRGNGGVRLLKTADLAAQDTVAYAALSYVWGMEQPVTNAANVTARCGSLPTESLPTTIKNAILATKMLGIPYLWVDSLCIIQDSKDDKAVEIAKMSKIYKQATVTISAAKASRCDQGFLEPRARILQLLGQSIGLPLRVPEKMHTTTSNTSTSSGRAHWTQNMEDLSELFLNEGSADEKPTSDASQMASSAPSITKRMKSSILRHVKVFGSGSDTKHIDDAPGVYGKVYLTADSTAGHDLSPSRGHSVFEPINSRAWTLQESWLSPRLLIYGEGPVRWKCLSCEKIEGYEGEDMRILGSIKESRSRFFATNQAHKNGREELTHSEGEAVTPSPTNPEPELNLVSMFKDFHATRDLMDMWVELVETYTSRALSVPSDKLPAISGLASEFHDLSLDEYHAGLWKKSLPRQLLWQSVGKDSPGADGSYGLSIPSQWRAPSWSWAAVNGEISFDIQGLVSRKTKPIPFRNVGSLAADIKYDYSDQVIVHSCFTQPAHKDAPFGEIVAANLVLSGPVHRMSLQQVKTRFSIHYGSPLSFFADSIVLDGGKDNPLFAIVEAEVPADAVLCFLELSKDGPAGRAGIVLSQIDRPQASSVAVNDPGDVGIDKGQEECPSVERTAYRRVAYWRMGSQSRLATNEGIEAELRDYQPRQARSWDWETNIRVETIKIV